MLEGRPEDLFSDRPKFKYDWRTDKYPEVELTGASKAAWAEARRLSRLSAAHETAIYEPFAAVLQVVSYLPALACLCAPSSHGVCFAAASGGTGCETAS